jgi:hypothetical protein
MTKFVTTFKNQKFNFDNLDAFKLFSQLMEKQRTLLSGLIPVKGGRGFINWGLYLCRLIQAKAPTKSTVRIMKSFALECFKIARCSGLGHLVKYLKTCSILLQQYVARNDATYDGRKVGGVAVSQTRKGLPRFIPRLERMKIRKGDVKTITLWLSLFNVYRYLECSYGSINTSTITEGNNFYLTPEIEKYISIFWEHISRKTGVRREDSLSQGKPFLSQKVSVAISSKDELPGTGFVAVIRATWQWRTLWLRLIADKKFVNGKLVNILTGHKWRKGNELLRGLTNILSQLYPDLKNIIIGMQEYTPKVIGEGSMIPWKRYVPGKYSPPNIGSILTLKGMLNPQYYTEIPLFGLICSPLKFGRLVALYEAAGKIRIIAIVDPFTQWALKPLHDWIFSILKKLPQDGTHDQAKPISNLLKLSLTKNDKFIGSCDMSAATDRLPIKLQIALLKDWFGSTFAFSWAQLLTSRGYYLKSKELFYKTGQPMGALSSWALLALVHHFMWQWAAWRSGETPTFRWFNDYAVLGDDSAALNRRVVEEYLKICGELGVKVNLSKSLLSRAGCLEFAKRFLTQRGDCSPISVGEILVSKINFSVMSNWPRKRNIRIADLLTLMGYRHKTLSIIQRPLIKLSRRLKHMLIVIHSPWGATPTKNLVQWLSMKSINDFSYPLDVTSVAINLIEMFYVIHTKSQKTVAWNALPNRLMGISGGRKKQDSAVELIRKEDGNTFRAVHGTIYEPLRKETFTKARKLMVEITSTRVLLMRRVFFIDSNELQMFFEKYLELEERLNNLRTDVLSQVPKDDFIMPSARSVVRLFNRLRTAR